MPGRTASSAGVLCRPCSQNLIKIDVSELRKNLIKDLDAIDDVYLSTIDLDDLSKDDVNNVKNKLKNMIISDEIINNNFNYKIDKYK